MFSSEQAIIDYVTSADYDTRSGTPFTDTPSGNSRVPYKNTHSKVGMAVIFNEAPIEGEVPKWDYTLRLNYTYGVSQFEEQVRTNARLQFTCRFHPALGCMVSSMPCVHRCVQSSCCPFPHARR